MSDVTFARAPRWQQWLFVATVFALGNRPVIMTASRRDSLVCDAEALDLAMKEIRHLQNAVDRARIALNAPRLTEGNGRSEGGAGG